MPRKGMGTLFFSQAKESPSSSTSHLPSPSRMFCHSVMAKRLELAESLINKWNQGGSVYASVTLLFYDNRGEAMEFIKRVNDLQKAMHSLILEDSRSEMLVRAQSLMQIAMKRLQKEFYQMLSMNRACLDPESVSARSSSGTSTRSSVSDDGDESEDEIRTAGDLITKVEDASEIAMADLKLIAECMISCGYGKECVHVYTVMRKSIVDESMYKLGVEKISLPMVRKVDWQVLDLRIKNWLNAVNVAVKTLFHGERILCDQVFATSESIRELCFAEIIKDGASVLFGFPEIVVNSIKNKTTENLSRTLDMYTSIANHWLEIESIFSSESTSIVKSQALNSIIKLVEFVRTSLTEFESSIQKDSVKSLTAGAGVDKLTIRVMSFLHLLSDYNVISDILFDSPLPAKSSLPDSYFDKPDFDESQRPEISRRFAWLVLVLLCKLDGKAKHYRNVSLSYLFLANNLQHVISNVRTSNLKHLLGDDWISKHEAKIKQFAANYERLGWHHVIDALPLNSTAMKSPEKVKESFKSFNAVFEEARRKHSAVVVPENNLRDGIKMSIARKLLPAYLEFYNAHAVRMRGERNFDQVVRFAPEDLENSLSGLFYGTASSSPSSSSSHSWKRRSG